MNQSLLVFEFDITVKIYALIGGKGERNQKGLNLHKLVKNLKRLKIIEL